MLFKAFFVLCALLALSSCAALPTVRDWRPWYRVDGNSATIQTGAKVKVEVVADNKALIGSTELEKREIKAAASEMLRRRGYTVVETDFKYLVRVAYETSRTERLNFTSTHSSTNFGSINTALGVNMAMFIAGMSYNSSGSGVTVSNSTGYINNLTVEVLSDSDILWKGSALWESNSININPDYHFSLKVLMSDIPKIDNIAPTVLPVKDSHAVNYFNVHCLHPLSSPGVPYKIYFVNNLEAGSAHSRIPFSISDNKILAACVDMVMNAEYALPKEGVFIDYSNPLDKRLWSDLQIANLYQMGNEQVTILMDLTSNQLGYRVNSCRVVSEEEFLAYKARLAKWEKALADYNDFYLK